ncbi:NHL repeat-containing protein [Microbacterium sp. ET2]|uniref:NHL repeat-containing protein n=1 Tax=Microbacterium albipurpureum TaxID=3050384 RepID=UPI00259CDC20|nr:NHL repeat-containing protein [Microbacterium sp. ET2 (Ac-2212)]WJL95041.1 NHL repeat-containing protein [Microbacterium sp. ET2 (Ac-2212)]
MIGGSMAQRRHILFWATAVGLSALALSACTGSPPSGTAPIMGTLAPVAGDVAVEGWEVTAWDVSGETSREIATATADDDGGFILDVPEDSVRPLILDARPADSEAALLAGIVAADAETATLNERTTVATGYGLAQFFDDTLPIGEATWLANAAAMASNLADFSTGEFGEVLRSSPNGSETSTLPTFTSLTAMLSVCLEEESACVSLFETAAGGSPVRSAAAAFAAIARDPSAEPDALFDLALQAAGTEPGLSDAPAAWTLALRFDGDGQSLDGPGNFAIDPRGHIWINNNYEYGDDPTVPVCGSDEMFEFAPDGELVASYSGGGLSGSGFGIDFDAEGRLWLSNYGFAAPEPGCPADQQPPHNSMTLFADGEFLSPDTGFTQGDLSWPQGIEVARNGDVWIANCGNDTVAVYPGGDPEQARNLGSLGLEQPFTAIDNGQLIFVSAMVNSAVAVVDYDGTPIAGSPLTGVFDRPMGLGVDADGNVWVANSGGISLPCPDRVEEGRGVPSVTMISPDGSSTMGPFTGGGVVLPWGLAVDGVGNVWVANFDGQRVSAFCGADPSVCPRGLDTGEGISPDDTGYSFDGLTRSTGIAVDPSGNVWVMNNWEQDPQPTNPGGHQIVAFVGAAPPVVVAPFADGG